MDTKTQQALDLFKRKEYKKAFAIFRTFKIGFTKEEQSQLKLTSEILSGHSDFYTQLGLDTDKEIQKGIELINQHYRTILKETPDSFIYDGKDISWKSTLSYAFCTLKDDTLLISNKNESHGTLLKRYDGFDKIDTYQPYGRIFINYKLITFWSQSYPKNKKDLFDFIEILNKHEGINIKSDWSIELLDKSIIPISEYINSKTNYSKQKYQDSEDKQLKPEQKMKIKKSQLVEIIHKELLKEGKLFDYTTTDELIEKIKKEINIPFLNIYSSTLGGKERISILLTGSLDEKSKWNNNILENSRFFKLYIKNDGIIEYITSRYDLPKFRKTTAKDSNDLIKKINKYIDLIK